MNLYAYRFPELGEGLHEGEVVKWLVKPGDTIKEDDILMEVQNDKSVVEVPSPVTGKIIELKVNEGTVSVVGDVLAMIEVEGEGTNSSAQEELYSEEEPNSEKFDKTEVLTKSIVLATPSTRKLARERHVDLSQIRGTGKNGRITNDDIFHDIDANIKDKPLMEKEQAVPVPKDKQMPQRQELPIATNEERVPLKGIRKLISEAMVKSAYTVPHVTVMDEADVSELRAFREKVKPLAEERGVKVTYLPFIVKALIAAARKFPVINASFDEEASEMVYKKSYHIGIATDTEKGLIVPVVKDADRKNIWSIAAEIRNLAQLGRGGKLSAEQMKGSTITITNIGSAGGLFFTPIINYPEVAILGTGRITEKPVVKNGEIVIGHVMALSLSFDHRIIDGAVAQQAVNYIKHLLENPQMFLMEV